MDAGSPELILGYTPSAWRTLIALVALIASLYSVYRSRTADKRASAAESRAERSEQRTLRSDATAILRQLQELALDHWTSDPDPRQRVAQQVRISLSELDILLSSIDVDDSREFHRLQDLVSGGDFVSPHRVAINANDRKFKEINDQAKAILTKHFPVASAA